MTSHNDFKEGPFFCKSWMVGNLNIKIHDMNSILLGVSLSQKYVFPRLKTASALWAWWLWPQERTASSSLTLQLTSPCSSGQRPSVTMKFPYTWLQFHCWPLTQENLWVIAISRCSCNEYECFSHVYVWKLFFSCFIMWRTSVALNLALTIFWAGFHLWCTLGVPLPDQATPGPCWWHRNLSPGSRLLWQEAHRHKPVRRRRIHSVWRGHNHWLHWQEMQVLYIEWDIFQLAVWAEEE